MRRCQPCGDGLYGAGPPPAAQARLFAKGLALAAWLFGTRLQRLCPATSTLLHQLFSIGQVWL
jgi:hypothetical protein